MVLPITAESPPNFLIQNEWLRIVIAGRRGGGGAFGSGGPVRRGFGCAVRFDEIPAEGDLRAEQA
jgi:hypothetical protein